MKKIFTLMTVAFAAVAASPVLAQENLLQNPTFEEWNTQYDRPEGWLAYDGVFSQVEGTTPDTYAVQWYQTGEDNASIIQYVNGLSELTEYTISFDYKITEIASENSFRNWFRWQNADRKYISNDNYTGSDLSVMQPDGFLENSSEWRHVTMTVTTPATAASLNCGFRVYGGSTAALANPIMVEGNGGGSGLTDAQAAKTGIYSANGSVYVLSDGVGTVEVYNLLGQLVRTEQVSDGCNELTGLDKGQVYVVRYGEKAQKVIL